MVRWEPSVWAFVAIALAWGCGMAVLGDRADWNPLVAPVSSVLVLAAFGWLRRQRDAMEIIGPAIAIGYLIYIGLALWRLSQPNLLLADQATPWPIGRDPARPLMDYWPVAVIGGIPIAMMLTIFVALPASRLPRRFAQDPVQAERDARYWAFYRDWNAQHTAPLPPIGPDRSRPLRASATESR